MHRCMQYNVAFLTNFKHRQTEAVEQIMYM